SDSKVQSSVCQPGLFELCARALIKSRGCPEAITADHHWPTNLMARSQARELDKAFVVFVFFCSDFRRRSPESTIGLGQNHPRHAIGQLHLVKVDDKAKRNVQELHITQELCFVDWQNLL